MGEGAGLTAGARAVPKETFRAALQNFARLFSTISKFDASIEGIEHAGISNFFQSPGREKAKRIPGRLTRLPMKMFCCS